MLFDEKDLNALENEDARDYFKEVLQSYYGQNYRAAIVTLYSFVIYDLFIKLQTMANEGDKKAEAKVKEMFKMNTTTSCGKVQTNPQEQWDLQEKYHCMWSTSRWFCEIYCDKVVIVGLVC